LLTTIQGRKNGRKEKGLYRYKDDSGNGCKAEAVEF
jgi:hypothetical protein